MSVEALTWALRVGGLTPRAKLVLIGLADSADRATWSCYPSRKSLAEVGDCSVDTVDRAMKELLKAGHLSVTGRTRNGGGQSSNLYTLTPSRKIAAPLTPAAEMRPPPPAEMPRGEPHSYAAGGAAYGAAPYEPSLEPPLKNRIVSKAEIGSLIDRAGDACDPTAPGLHHGADLNRMIRGGCDWASDIEPAVDQLAASFRRRGKRFATWSLLEEHAVQNRDRRLAGVPAPSKPSEKTNGRNGSSPERDAWDRVLAEVEGNAPGRSKPPVALGG